jgi:hypothetical protein
MLSSWIAKAENLCFGIKDHALLHSGSMDCARSRVGKHQQPNQSAEAALDNESDMGNAY